MIVKEMQYIIHRCLFLEEFGELGVDLKKCKMCSKKQYIFKCVTQFFSQKLGQISIRGKVGHK